MTNVIKTHKEKSELGEGESERDLGISHGVLLLWEDVYQDGVIIDFTGESLMTVGDNRVMYCTKTKECFLGWLNNEAVKSEKLIHHDFTPVNEKWVSPLLRFDC